MDGLRLLIKLQLRLIVRYAPRSYKSGETKKKNVEGGIWWLPLLSTWLAKASRQLSTAAASAATAAAGTYRFRYLTCIYCVFILSAYVHTHRLTLLSHFFFLLRFSFILCSPARVTRCTSCQPTTARSLSLSISMDLQQATTNALQQTGLWRNLIRRSFYMLVGSMSTRQERVCTPTGLCSLFWQLTHVTYLLQSRLG